MDKKFLSILGLARRAGKLSLGFDAVCVSLTKRKARLVLIASDTSEKTAGRITPKCGLSGAQYYNIPFTMDEIGIAVGKRIGVLSIDDKGFAQRISEMIPYLGLEECK